MIPIRDRLASIGQRLKTATRARKDVLDEAHKAVRAGADEGVSEVEMARLVGVTRMTIRSWLGKR